MSATNGKSVRIPNHERLCELLVRALTLYDDRSAHDPDFGSELGRLELADGMARWLAREGVLVVPLLDASDLFKGAIQVSHTNATMLVKKQLMRVCEKGL